MASHCGVKYDVNTFLLQGEFHKEHLKKKPSFANVDVQNKKARKPCPVRVGRRVWSGFKKSA